MKVEKNILVAFFLNFVFSIFEFVGGIFIGSSAILSDSIHDFGDSISIACSFFLEKVGKKKPNNKYTFGYKRFSVLGGLITTLVLLIGSIFVIYNAILRFIYPIEINYSGMIIFALVGLVVNLIAARFTHGGHSINQKAVNLHMLEDVFGWVIVLIGAVLMLITDIRIIDPILSILVACFIIFNALKNLKEILDLFLLKAPKTIDIDKIKNEILKIDGVKDVHHIHLWSIDGENNLMTLHVVLSVPNIEVKKEIKHRLKEVGIAHVTVEIETAEENCLEKECVIEADHCPHHHHHH